MPPDAAVFSRAALVYAPHPVDVSAEVVVLPGAEGVDLAAALGDLGDRHILDLLVEGGPVLAGALLECGFVDRGVAYLGARLAGGAGTGWFSGAFATLSGARHIRIDSVTRIGPDLRVDFRLADDGDPGDRNERNGA